MKTDGQTLSPAASKTTVISDWSILTAEAVTPEPTYFFFSSRRRHTRSLRDWSSDVCSSDLHAARPLARHGRVRRRPGRLPGRAGRTALIAGRPAAREHLTSKDGPFGPSSDYDRRPT